MDEQNNAIKSNMYYLPCLWDTSISLLNIDNAYILFWRNDFFFILLKIVKTAEFTPKQTDFNFKCVLLSFKQ